MDKYLQPQKTSPFLIPIGIILLVGLMVWAYRRTPDVHQEEPAAVKQLAQPAKP